MSDATPSGNIILRFWSPAGSFVPRTMVNNPYNIYTSRIQLGSCSNNANTTSTTTEMFKNCNRCIGIADERVLTGDNTTLL